MAAFIDPEQDGRAYGWMTEMMAAGSIEYVHDGCC